MKIAYLSESALPSRAANSVHVMNMCAAFANLGHEVLLLAHVGDKGMMPSDELFSFYGLAPGFEVKRFRIPNVRGRPYWYGMRAALQARVWWADLAYGRDLYSCFFAVLLGLPVVYEAHAPSETQRPAKAWVTRQLLGSSYLKRLVVISDALGRTFLEGTKADLEGTKADSEKLLVAHDAARDHPRTLSNPTVKLNGVGSGLKVGYVGHLYPGRGIEVIVELARRCPWAQFHIVGGTAEHLRFWRVEAAGVGNVQLHGFVPPAQAQRYCQACDVLLAPYQTKVAVAGESALNTAEYMSPLKIFEYMATGKPIVCSDLPVLREVLRHKDNAWLCSPDRVDQWQDALVQLHDQPDLRRRLGEQARHDFEVLYTWEVRANKVLQGIAV